LFVKLQESVYSSRLETFRINRNGFYKYFLKLWDKLGQKQHQWVKKRGQVAPPSEYVSVHGAGRRQCTVR